MPVSSWAELNLKKSRDWLKRFELPNQFAKAPTYSQNSSRETRFSMNLTEAHNNIYPLFKKGLTQKELLKLAVHYRRIELEKELSNHFKNQIAEGPFKGLLTVGKAYSSTLCPKLLGSYEKEIYSSLRELSEGKSCFIDIGCAEGYYTTGIAATTSIPKIIGIDIDEAALTQATASAKLNNVGHKCLFTMSLEEGLNALESNCLAMIDVDGNELEILNKFCSGIKQKGITNSSIIIETDQDSDGYSNANAVINLLEHHNLMIKKVIEQDVLQRFSALSQKMTISSLDLFLMGFEGRPLDQKWIIAQQQT